MKRRTFLTATSALAGSLALSKPSIAGDFSGKIKKAVKFHMITGKASVLDKFQMLKDLGYDGVETRAAMGDKNRDLVESYKAASEKTGLPIHGLIHSDNPTIADAVDQAKFLGASSILHVVPYDTKLGYKENYKKTQSVIREAIPQAEKQQVMILLENVWATFLIDPVSMARYIDELESPMVGSYFDVGNVVRWGWPPHWVEVLGPRIKKLDIKEYDLTIAMNEGMRKAFNKPLGEGSIDWSQVRAELANIGYTGWATAEVRGGDRERLAEIAGQMDRVLDLA